MHLLAFQIGSALVLLTGLARANPPPEKVLPQIVMATLTAVSTTPLARAHGAIFAEAFRRLGYEMVTVNLPPARASAQAEANQIDGELTRGTLYGRLHPTMFRLEYPVYHATLAAYSLVAGTDMSGWSSLRHYKVEYRHGIEAARYALAAVVPPTQLSAVPTTLQGLKKLAAGRTDVYIDFDEHVSTDLQQHEIRPRQTIVRRGTMEELRIHAYLSSKHGALAVQLATVLQQMQREGAIAAYQRAAKAAQVKE